MKRKPLIILGAAVLIAGSIGAVVLGNQIRTVLSVAQSANMNEEERTARVEENTQIEQEQRDRYQLPQGEADPNLSAAVEEGSLSLEEAAAILLESGSAEPVETPPEAPPSQTEEPAPAEPAPSQQNSSPVPETPSIPDPAVSEEPEAPRTPPSQPQEAPQEQPEPSSPEEQPEPPSPEEQRLRNLVAQMYVLRGVFSSRLDGIIASCVSEYLALDPSQQNAASKMRIAYARLDEIASLEEECDSQVADIVAQIRQIDPEEASRVQRQYENEKAEKKAALVDQYS